MAVPNTFSPNTKAKSDEVNTNFDDLVSGDADSDDNSLRLYRKEAFSEFVSNGLIWSQVSGLDGAMTSGVAYINSAGGIMLRVALSAIASRTFTASKDTYVDVDATGTFTYPEVTLAATAPALTANSIRIAKVTTDATNITAVTQADVDSNGIFIYNVGGVGNAQLANDIAGEWRSWAYNVAGLTGASETVTGAYNQLGKKVSLWIHIALGATPSAMSNITFDLPVTARAGQPLAVGAGKCLIGTTYPVGHYFNGVNSYYLRDISPTNHVYRAYTTTTPATFSSSSALSLAIQYEAA